MLVFLVNTYPVYVSRQFVFQSKRDTLLTRANMFASTLSGLEPLEPELVGRVMAMLEDRGGARVLVVDDNLRVVYDNSVTNNAESKLLLTSEIRRAFEGLDVFSAALTGEAVESRTAVPVMVKGAVVGVVYLYETDSEQAELVLGIQRNMASVSVIIFLAAAAASVIISIFVTRRTGILLEAIRNVREGDYGHRALVEGRDEISQLAAEFNALSERLNRVEEMRRQFVSDASHELKTPLASVKILTDSILQNDNIPSHVVREFVGDIGDEIERLSRLSDKLLNITRLDASLPREVYPVDLSRCVLHVAHMLKPLYEKEEVNILFDMTPGVCADLNDDAAYQIAFNLMENAIKYNIRGGSVNIRVSEDEEGILFTVGDTGVGIPKDELPRIFDRFYRVDKARSREAGGSGLGLAIVRDTVLQYGGQVSASSEVGGGTLVIIRFPPSEGGKSGT